MDVSRDVLHGLTLLSESRQRVTDDEVVKILQTVSRSLVWQTGEDKELGDDMERAEERLSCLSLISLLTSTARLNTGMESEIARIRDVLNDCEVSKKRSEMVVHVYQNDRQRLQERLAALTTIDEQLPAFRDVKWTQEVILKSNTLHRLQSPVIQYLISVKHESGSVDFCADVDDLQQLVHSVRECCKAIDAVKQQGQH